MDVVDRAARGQPAAPGELDADTRQVLFVIAQTCATLGRFALNKAEAAALLGVSVEFFDEHVAPELRVVRRGRRSLYSVGAVIWWLWRSGEGPPPLP